MLSSLVRCGLLVLIAAFVSLHPTLLAQSPKPKPSKKPRNPVFQDPVADDSLPNVMLIGDSISIGYTLAVRDELKGVANVYRPPTNCGPTTRGLESLDAWISGRKYAVIHANFGLHDLKYMGPGGKNLADPKASESFQQVPPKEYRANLETILSKCNPPALPSSGAKQPPSPKALKAAFLETRNVTTPLHWKSSKPCQPKRRSW